MEVRCIQSVPEAEAESGMMLIRVEMELKRRMAIGEECSALPHQSAQALPFPQHSPRFCFCFWLLLTLIKIKSSRVSSHDQGEQAFFHLFIPPCCIAALVLI
ncbi:hypothetical protein NC651_032540 [Populus alba x Populus x berolinensis]|nr:hypothetical protein NC651_032540 [Populus alba x Populus x berolinensis]